MKGTKVASRYAQSLLDLAVELDKTTEVTKDIESFIAASNDSRDFQLLLNNPIIDASKKNDIFEKVFPGFSSITMSFIKLLTKNKREAYLPIISKEYIAKLKKLQGIVPATLTSASKLDPEVMNKIVTQLQGQVDGKLEIEEIINPELIGGFVFRTGDMQIEASLARQLKELEQSLTR